MKAIVSILCLISLSAGLFASEPDQKIDLKTVLSRAPSRESLVPTQSERDARLGWWREARFGMFITWGLYSELGGTWNGQKSGTYAEQIQQALKIPIATYRDGVAGKFNPIGFNADEWVRIAKETGMGYLTITAKFSDGFAMYGSTVSDYNVVKATPWGRDPVAELRVACKKYGIKFGFYYSQALDWGDKDAPGNDWDYKNPGLNQPNWWQTLNPPFLAQARHYVDTKAIPQIRELIQNYDPDMIWFDVPHYLPGEENLRILAAVRKAKPSMVINSRLVDGLGDYESTDDKPGEFPPQSFPDWEGIPTTNGSYGFNQNDHSHKQPKYFIQLLAKAAARGGNIILNAGPMGDGKMDPKDISIYQAIGNWWKVNGESIRGTTATPLAVQVWGESTRKGNDLYLHVFDWPKDGHLVVGGIKSTANKAVLLSDPQTSLKVTSHGMDMEIDIPSTAPDPVDSVIKITCDEVPQGDKARLISSSQINVLRSLDGKITGGLIYNNCQQTDFLRNWKKLDATVTWPARLNKKTTFDVSVLSLGEKAHPEIPGNPDAGQMPRPATKGNGGTFQVSFGGQTLQGLIAPSEGYLTSKLGQVTLEPGNFDVEIKGTEITGDELMHLRQLVLTPVDNQPTPLPKQVFVVPNFHPASCGWLTNWSKERNYCANSYLNHLDRVRDDANYNFVLSECNNMIAIQNFQPKRFAELKERVKQGRVELVNAFFLEPTINLSGGEALAKMGIEGLRWQQQVMGVRPRYCWAIDTCGSHAQMPQICDLLGLDAYIFTRCNRSGKTIAWHESPDGSRILSFIPDNYSDDIGGIYGAKNPLSPEQLKLAEIAISKKSVITPAGAPVVILGGRGDYALAPEGKDNPTGFLSTWKKHRPDCDIRYSTFSPYVDKVLPQVKAGEIKIPTVTTGLNYLYESFWVENPRVKGWYRRDEHALQSAEMLATIASLKSKFAYPVMPLYHAWLQMLLNMDRNTLWGAAGGMVFEHATSWDAKDRFEWVEKQSATTLESAARAFAGAGKSVSIFNPVNWQRRDPVRLKLPENTSISGAKCEALGDGSTLCLLELPSLGIVGAALQATPAATPKPIALQDRIETEFYSAKVDPITGSLVSLKTKTGREMLGGPANEIVAEQHSCGDGPKWAGEHVDLRPKRKRLAGSSDFKATVQVTEGPIAITVEAHSEFYGGGKITRVTRFFKNHPRIEFETELNDIPNLTVVVAEFPLAHSPTELFRGIPFGFSRDTGVIGGIAPAIRWTDYSVPGKGGVALLDRGATPGRELDKHTPVIYLLSALDKYQNLDCAWLSGKGRNRFEYALVAHDEDFSAARIPQRAWEYNSPVAVAANCQAAQSQAFIQTSDNMIVEAMRRDGSDIELRLVEALGQPGTAEVKVSLPHSSAALTDLTGNHAMKLEGGPAYKFPVRPQQIITIRLRTKFPVAEVQPLLDWSPLVPPGKQADLTKYLPSVIGHPPSGN